MARISRYDFDITVSKEDKLIGTDSGGSTTKNFKLEDLTTFFSKQQEILGSKFSYTYKNITDYTKLEAGHLTVNSPADTVNFSSITDVYIYKLNADNLSIEAYLNEIKTSDSAIAIFNNEDTTSFGVYKITSITTQITNVLRLQLTQVAKNGTVLNKNLVNLGIIPAVDAINTLAQTLAVGNTTGSTNIVVQKSIQLPTTTTNTGTPTDQGVISFGGTYTNGNRIFNDTSGGTLRIQASDNLHLQPSNLTVSNSNGNLITAGDTGTKLYYQNSEKLATTTTGVSITNDLSLPDNGILSLGDSDDIKIQHYVGGGDSENKIIFDGDDTSIVQHNPYILRIKCESSGGSEEVFMAFAGQSQDVNVYKDFRVSDDKKLYIGNGNDIEIYHNNTSGNNYFNVSSSGIQGTAIKDEDDMSSNSAVHLATQQSIKAYVDDKIQTLEEVEDIVGNMVSSNTESGISVTYDDTGGKLNFNVSGTTTEEIQDVIGGMVSGNTETNISVTYDDTAGKLNFVSTDTNTQLSTEEVQDIIGAMVSSNTETNISVTYDDTNGKLDFVSTDTNTQLTTEEVQDIVGAMFSGNTETRIGVTYDDSDGTIDLVVDDMTTDTNTQLSNEQVQDIVGAMFTGNTETNISATYQDGDGTIDLVATGTTYGISAVDGDNTDEEKIRLTDGDGTTDDVVLEAGTGLSIARSSDKITFTNTVTDTNTQLSQEQVEDFVGGMLDGTETGISVSYDDTDGNIDFVVSDTTVAGDSGSTGITPGDTLTIAGGTNVTTAMSGDTLTITSTDTNTQLSTEQVQDIVGAMFSGNTETRIAVTYEDGDGTIDLVVDDMTANTDVDVSNANLLARLAALESSGGAANENIVIGTDSGDTIVITGNLQVSGTTTTVDSTTVNLNDHNIVLDSGNSTSAVINGAGITLEGGTGDDATFTYSTTGPQFEMKLGSAYEDLQIAGLKTSGIVSSGDVTIDAGASSTLNIYKDDAGNGKLSFYNDSTQQVFLLHDAGDNFYIHAGSGSAMIISTNGATTLTLDTSNNATFAGYVAATQFRPTNIVTNKVVKFDGTRLDDSIITDDGSTVTVAGNVAISHGSGDTLTLTKTTTEPSLRIEGDTDKDFVITVSGELLTFTQNDGATDILTLDHDTKAATFAGSATIETGINLESGVLVIKNATGDANGLRIFQDSSDASKIYNNYNGTLQLGVGNTTAITIDSSENTTFAGAITVQSGNKLILNRPNNAIDCELSTDSSGTLILNSRNSEGFKFQNNGTNFVTGDSSGNVGIGTASPSYTLDVYHATTNVVSRFKSGDNQAWISVQDDDSGTYGALFGTDSDANHEIVLANHAATKRLVIKDGGNVGIGVDSPDRTLHVSSSENQLARFESTDAYAGIELKDNGSSTLPPLISALSDDFIFYGGHASSRPAIMFLDSSTANVGIGTASPAALLDVSSGTTTDVIRFGADSRWGFSRANSDNRYLSFMRNQNGSGTAVWTVDGDNGKVGIGTTTPDEKLDITGGYLKFNGGDYGLKGSASLSYNATSDHYFQSGGSTKVTFKADGKVGIGTGAPYTNLEVIGGLNVSTNTTSATTTTMRIGSYGASSQTYYGAKLVAHTNFTATANADLSFDLGDLGEVMRLHCSGTKTSVGIGTTAAYAFDTTNTKLHVKNDSAGSGNVGEVARFEGSSDADGSGGTIRLGTSNDRGIYFEGGRTGSVPYGIIGTTEYNGAKTYSIYLQNTGNVGIGTESPSTKLHVVGANGAVTPSSFSVFDLTVADNAEAAIGILGNSYSSIYLGDAADPNMGAVVYNHSTNALDLRVNGNATAVTVNSDKTTTFAANIHTDVINNKANSANIIYRSGTSTLVGGGSTANKLYVLDSGNIGIGTDSPSNKFVVAEGTDQHGIELAPGTLSYIQAYDRATSDYGDLKIDAETIQFGTNNGSERMRITSAGDVGIGTTSPNQDGWSSTNTVATIKGTASGARGVLELIGLGNSDDNEVGVINFMSQAETSPLAAINGLRHTSDTSGKLSFDTAGAERMRITETGNVGIGTTSPNSILQLSSTGPTELLLSDTNAGSNVKNYGIYSDTGKLHIRRLTDAYSGYSSSITVDRSNVGIGTSSPAFLLHVVGDQDILKIEGSGASGPQLRTYDSSTASDGDIFGMIDMAFKDSAGNETIGNRIKSVVNDVTNGTEDTSLEFFTLNDANSTKALTLDYLQDATFAGDIYGNDRLYLGTKMALDVNGTDLYLGSTTSANHNDTVYIRTNDANRVTITDSSATFAGQIGLGGTGVYTTSASLNIDGLGLAIKNDTAGSSNNWSLIKNTATSSSSNLAFITGAGTAVTINHDKSVDFESDIQAPGVYVGSTNTSFDFYNNGTSYLNGTTTIDADTTISGYTEIGNDTANVSNDGSWNARLNVAGTLHARLDVRENDTDIIATLYAHTGHNASRVGSVSSHKLEFLSGGNVRGTVATNGDYTAVGDVVAYSDKKLKENIKTLNGSKVYDMRGVSFTRKDSGKDGSGVIAQELQKVAPELITETDGTLGVAYGNLTGYLIEAIKDLKAEIEELKKQIK